jgi:alpha-mannosidase
MLDNGILRVRIASDGTVESVVHLASGRETLAGPGNRFAIHRDNGDAWDFSLTYHRQEPERAVLATTSARIDGPHAIVTQAWTSGTSTITQELVLTAGSGRLEFRTVADWQDGGRMLRTSFPVAVRSDHATCHIQFGTIQRPTHRNTAWDAAKDEICCNTFLDLSEPTHGVALLNDGKYGHRAHGNVLDLHLLRTPGAPDPVADRAVHRFTYALYPHVGDHVAGRVLREGYDLNCPLRTVAVKPGAAPLPSLATVDAEHVVIEAVKRAEDGAGTVLRLFEAAGAEATTRVRFGFAVKKAWLTDLHEQPVQALKVVDGGVELALRPFQIVTLKLA